MILQWEEGSFAMITAVLFTVFAAILVRFALHYWRTKIHRVAAQHISDRVRIAAGIGTPEIGAQNIHSLLTLHDLAQDLRGPTGAFRAVRAYYAVVEKLGSLIPAMADWANGEMVTCARYVAVRVDQHLERNMARAAQIRRV
jgi:hypothetical protein